MSEPENFLSRWSRRKAAATEKDVGPAATPDAEAKAQRKRSNKRNPAPPLRRRKNSRLPPEFDPATLPSLESIVAGTDIRAFLQPACPRT